MSFFSIHNFYKVALLVSVAFALAGPVQAQEQSEGVTKLNQSTRDGAVKIDAPIVIETFTTADCSACVFADRMLYDAMQDKNVIALSCYIKDMSGLGGTPAAPGSDDRPMDPCVFRQWAFTNSPGAKDVTINVPSFVFNGEDLVDGNNPKHYGAVLDAFHLAGKNRTMWAAMQWKDADTVSVTLPRYELYEKEKRNASIWLIRYKDLEIQKVEEGMNKGRVLRFSNIIQDVKHIGKWHGAERSIDIDVGAPPSGDLAGGYVVVVGEVLGSTYLVAGKLADYPVKAPASAASAPAQ